MCDSEGGKKREEDEQFILLFLSRSWGQNHDGCALSQSQSEVPSRTLPAKPPAYEVRIEYRPYSVPSTVPVEPTPYTHPNDK